MIVTLFDTETDGLIANSLVSKDFRPRVMEWYSVRYRVTGRSINSAWNLHFEKLDEIDRLFNIGRKVNALWERGGRKKKSATQVTGIKDEDLEGKPDFKSAADEIREQFEGSDLIVAHNLDFDFRVTNYEFDRFGLPPVSWPKGLCTVEATEHLFGYRIKLEDLYKHLFGHPFKNPAHRAKVDVEHLVECYIELTKLGEIE